VYGGGEFRRGANVRHSVIHDMIATLTVRPSGPVSVYLFPCLSRSSASARYCCV